MTDFNLNMQGENDGSFAARIKMRKALRLYINCNSTPYKDETGNYSFTVPSRYPGIEPGIVGNCYRVEWPFDSHYSIISPANTLFLLPYSINFLIKNDIFTFRTNVILADYNYAAELSAEFYFDGVNQRLNLYYYANGSNVFFDKKMNPSEWYMVTITIGESGTGKAYFNSVKEFEYGGFTDFIPDRPAFLPDTDMNIYFIDEFKIFNDELTQSAITSLYNNYFGG